MTFDQRILYSLILPSAKRKLKNQVNFPRQFEIIADHILIKLVLELTAGKSNERIALQLSQELTALGYRSHKEHLLRIVSDMGSVINKEVELISLMYVLQENGYSDQEITNMISESFSNNAA